MNDYIFQLIFKLRDDEDPKLYLDQLFEAGCDDAIFGVATKGTIGAEFNREAKTAFDAISTAIENIKKAIPHAKIIKADPFIYNLTEMSVIFNCTKQNLSKYARNNKTFPSPIISGKIDYWYVFDVACWLWENQKLNITEQEVELYRAIYSLSDAIEKVKNKQKDDFLDIAKKMAA